MTNLTFGDVINRSKTSNKTYFRENWNGSGIRIYYVPANSYKAQTPYAKSVWGEEGLVPYGAYFAIKTANNTVEAGWRPTTLDMFATDWVEE